MLLDINKIKVHDRIRKELGNIDELAKDIQENGLINPPVVTPEYKLIAGERRLNACRSLGFAEIQVNIMTVRDYEHQLRLEISENESRKDFTFSERQGYTERLIKFKQLLNDYEIVFIWIDEWVLPGTKKGSIAALTASNPE